MGTVQPADGEAVVATRKEREAGEVDSGDVDGGEGSKNDRSSKDKWCPGGRGEEVRHQR